MKVLQSSALTRVILFRLLLPLVLVLTSLYLAVAFYFSGLIVDAKPALADQNLIRNLQNYENIVPAKIIVTTDKGNEFDAWHFKRFEHTTCIIIFTHGWKSSRLKMHSFFDAFSDTECDFVSYDLRGHGIHHARYSSGGILEKRELVKLSKVLGTTFSLAEHQIGWFGVSLGASTALQAAGKDFQPAFIVADSPFQDWHTAIFERGVKIYGGWVERFQPGVRAMIFLRTGIDYMEASALRNAEKIQSPVLLIHSLSDIDTAPSQSTEIFKRLDINKAVLSLNDWGAAHAKDVDQRPQEYKQLINNFICDHVASFVAHGRCALSP